MVPPMGEPMSTDVTSADNMPTDNRGAPTLTMQPLPVSRSPSTTTAVPHSEHINHIGAQPQDLTHGSAGPTFAASAAAAVQNPSLDTPTADVAAAGSANTPSISSSLVSGIIEDVGAFSPRLPRAAAPAGMTSNHRYGHLSVQERCARARDKISAGSRSPALQKDYKKTHVNIMLYGESGLGKTVSSSKVQLNGTMRGRGRQKFIILLINQ